MAPTLWPLFDLRLFTERLVLRLPTDDDLDGLIAVSRDIHPPEEMPFGIAWTDVPSPEFERESLMHHWRGRANWTLERWDLNLAAFLDDRPIGALSLHTERFPVLREVATGSWLGRRWQGHGFGREMRAAGLTLAFEGLGAEVAVSSAFLDNHASSGVSRSLGYEPDGFERLAPRGVARTLQRWRMTRERWAALQHPSARIEGLEGCRDMFEGPAG